MIQLLYTYNNEDILKEELKLLGLPFISVNEMLENSYLTVLEVNEVDTLENALKQPPLKMDFIGTYNMDGTQYIWTEPGSIQRNHSINKYKNSLKGEPTEEEALEIQVNKISGKPDRIINTYGTTNNKQWIIR